MEFIDLLTKEQRKEYVKEIHLEKDEILFHEGDTCNEIGIVLSGEVQIVSYTYSGNELVYATVVEGSQFGTSLIFSSDPTYKGNILAKRKTVLALINKTNLLTLFSLNKEFMLSYLKYVSDFGKNLNTGIKLLSYQSAEERLDYLFYVFKGSISYKNVTSLANTLKIKRETLSRLLSKLESENKIIRTKNQIKLIK